MSRLLPLFTLVVLIVSAAVVNAQWPEPSWPKELAACPSFVRLDRTKMQDVDGQQAPTYRKRPWPDAQGKTQHCPLVVENMYLHHFLNKKAIMINTGSADKPRVDGQIASYTSVIFRNLDIGLVYRTQPGLHMDHIWIGGGHDPAIQPDVTFEDVFIHDGNAGVMPILFEAGGNWGTLTFRRVAVAKTANTITVKLGNSSFKGIFIEDSPNIRVFFQGDGAPVTVHVRNCPGADIQCPRDGQGKRSTQVTIVREPFPGSEQAEKRHMPPGDAINFVPTTQPTP
ncbi:MAG: hypothetical protein ACM359_14970 [Bacillota bacterium]